MKNRYRNSCNLVLLMTIALLLALLMVLTSCAPRTVAVAPVSHPLYCKRTLGTIDCYPVEDPFGFKYTWNTAGPPEIDINESR